MNDLSGLPYAHLNLRWNPFGELSAEDRASVAVVELGPVVSALWRPGVAVQFVGTSGRGKTTHLLALRRHFPRATYVRADPERAVALPESDPLLVDEGQFLSRTTRRSLYQRAPFAMATHLDYRDELTQVGIEAHTVMVDVVCPRRLEAILERRIAWARRGVGPIPCLASGTGHKLLRRFGADVRAIEDHLYEVFQDLDGVRSVEV